MTNKHLGVGILIASSSIVLAQGPLEPPTIAGPTGPVPPLAGGVPQASMKTLHEVEPSTAINATNTPGDASFLYIIDTPGAYHLTRNEATFGQSVIQITAAGVTVDLRGFELQSFSSEPYGISIGADADRCTIRNGSIKDYDFGVFRVLSGADEAEGGSFIDLSVSGHSSIALLGGNGWTALNCRVQGGGNSGIVLGEGAVVSHCTVRGMKDSDGTNGIQVRDASSVSNCTVSDCDVIYGIRTGEGSTIENSASVSNTSTATFGLSFGILAGARSVLRGCVASGMTSSGSTIEHGAGISAEFSCLVVNCMANNNAGAGIIVSEASEIRNCKAHFNGGPGIYALNFGATATTNGWNKVVGNDITFNATGIALDTAANVVVQNSIWSNTENFSAIANNNIGPIAVVPDSPTISGGGGGQAAGVGTTDPWANLTW